MTEEHRVIIQAAGHGDMDIIEADNFNIYSTPPARGSILITGENLRIERI